MVRKLDTHYYDGKLKDRFLALKNAVSSPVSLDICWKEIRLLIDNSLREKNKKKHDVAMMIWRTMKSDVGRPGNFDRRSGIRVQEVLPLVWTLIKSWDDSGKNVFLEQWIDIKGGMCPQGRVARLMQMACFEK